jgi:hypothetical protein
MSALPSFKVAKASNGYIVHVLVTGESVLKDPYIKPTFVFRSDTELKEWIGTWCLCPHKAIDVEENLDD